MNVPIDHDLLNTARNTGDDLNNLLPDEEQESDLKPADRPKRPIRKPSKFNDMFLYCVYE